MCQNPLTMYDGTVVSCLRCEDCRDLRVSDWVGRCCAEQSTSSKTVALTLTYRSGNPGSGHLIYSDVQQMLKRLRKKYSVRYFVVGEYGSEKGRAHWHCILFFKGQVPEFGLYDTVKQTWDYWPHGFVYFQNAEYRGFKYLLKYMLKDQHSESSERKPMMSKKPPLGYDYFMTEAYRYAKVQLPVHDAKYRFDWVRTSRSNKPREFILRGRMLFLFLQEYVRLFALLHNKLPPESDFIYERYFDPIAKAEMDNDPLLFAEHVERKAAEFVRKNNARVYQSPSYVHDVAKFLLPKPVLGVVTLRSDGSARLDHGDATWLLCDGNDSAGRLDVLRKSLRLSPVPSHLHASICQWYALRARPCLKSSGSPEASAPGQTGTGS